MCVTFVVVEEYVLSSLILLILRQYFEFLPDFFGFLPESFGFLMSNPLGSLISNSFLPPAAVFWPAPIKCLQSIVFPHNCPIVHY